MSDSIFPYPGGKTYLADWIIEKFPEHDCFVEVFGGSASILINKPQSRVEVFNDLDGDVVHFFDVLRERPTELQAWLEAVPYSRELHSRWVSAFYDGDRSDDPIERAGIFYYLRYTQFSGGYDGPSGFSAARSKDEAGKVVRAVDNLEAFAERLRHVTIEQQDHTDLFEKYDGSDTLFYCDPPYVQEGDALYSQDEPFDHRRFVNDLHDIDGMWIVSYTDLPPGLEDYHVVERKAAQCMSDVETRKKAYRTERLVMNFSPGGEPIMTEHGQSGLNQFV